ncbi:MAG: hypothetical protein WKF31_04900 [Thermoleophilaceae bacterium]
MAESWPTDGIATSFYSRHKAEVERRLDAFEAESPSVRVVRLRPGLIFAREAASGIRRLFAGPFLPGFLVRPGLIPVVPDLENLRFQAVHSHDIAEAYRLAVTGGHAVPSTSRPSRCSTRRSWDGSWVRGRCRCPPRCCAGRPRSPGAPRLQPTEPGWLDMALGMPLMDTTRAREELGWQPRRTSGEALLELMAGMRDGAGLDTPPLAPGSGGPLRVDELRTGVGKRSF